MPRYIYTMQCTKTSPHKTNRKFFFLSSLYSWRRAKLSLADNNSDLWEWSSLNTLACMWLSVGWSALSLFQCFHSNDNKQAFLTADKRLELMRTWNKRSGSPPLDKHSIYRLHFEKRSPPPLFPALLPSQWRHIRNNLFACCAVYDEALHSAFNAHVGEENTRVTIVIMFTCIDYHRSYNQLRRTFQLQHKKLQTFRNTELIVSRTVYGTRKIN